jgi:LPXTG-motif cell wall-anchored protein
VSAAPVLAPAIVTASGRRGLVRAVAACVIGAAITLFAVTRTWSTTLAHRPAPLPPVHTPHTGSSQVGWLVAVALVALAGAGALLATRGNVRVVLGALLGLVGLVIFGGGVDGLHLITDGRYAWPVLVMAGGVLVAYAGLLAMREGPSWPAMGAKYERPDASTIPKDRPVTDATMWDDLDRGVDPTAGDGRS